ncbi:MAG: hypothetical protein JNK33_04665 [Candidatus Doudnabacteria bacterium]|nr:hypothetical protein [Candidatus Doudnabacteria bacterium]
MNQHENMFEVGAPKSDDAVGFDSETDAQRHEVPAEMFDSYLEGNALVPQRGFGVACFVGRHVFGESSDVWREVFDARFSPEQLSKLEATMNYIHIAHGVPAGTAAFKHKFPLGHAVKDVSTERVARLWPDTQVALRMALVRYVSLELKISLRTPDLVDFLSFVEQQYVYECGLVMQKVVKLIAEYWSTTEGKALARAYRQEFRESKNEGYNPGEHPSQFWVSRGYSDRAEAQAIAYIQSVDPTCSVDDIKQVWLALNTF